MSNKEAEFPVGEYVDVDGHRFAVLAAWGDNYWVKWVSGEFCTYDVNDLRGYVPKPYVAPVVVERRIAVYLENDYLGAIDIRLADREDDIVKLTFENGKLVKAEVENGV